MREEQPAARVGQDDLARVHVACEDEVERALRQLPGDAGEVAEQDAEVGLGVGELRRTGAAARVQARIDPDELDAAATQLDASPTRS